jgi:TolB protein
MSFPRSLRRLLAVPALLALTAALLPVLSEPASATFPGHNGKIVFASDRSHFFDIYTVLPNGHGVHRVTSDPFLQLGPVFSPNTSRIAYAQCCNNGNFDIYAIDANGSGARRLTNNHGQDIDPSYSKKGKIAYASEHGGNYDIWVMNGDGSHKHRITHDKSDELEPAWNPGGTKIAYQSTKTGHGDIYTMSPTGHDVKRITSNDGVDKEPTWSPSGKKICFSALREANSKLYVVPAHRGGKGRKLTHGAGNDQDPTWSPDGKRIAFVGIRGGARGGDIFTIGAQGGNLQKVVGSAKTYDVKPDWGRK